MSGLLWALIAAPAALGGLLVVADRRADRLASASAVAVAFATLVLALVCASERPTAEAAFLAAAPASLAVDGFSAVMVVTVAATTLLVLLYAAADLRPPAATGRFFGLMLLFAAAMLVTVSARNLLTLLIAWEVMGATSWALIGYWWQEPRRITAANTAFLTTRAADLGLYLAAGAAVAGGDHQLTLAGLAGLREPWLSLAAAGVVAAAFGKSAQLPFSFWLSRAMEGPSPVSALLHSATMVAAGAYLLLRVSPLLTAADWAASTVAWTGATTALLLGAVAVAQRDLKQLLAASTSAQVGFMLLAAGLFARSAGALQLVAHAATKSLLFLAAGAWLAALGTKDLAALRGAARRYPAVGVAFMLAAASLAGLAPLSLWAAKDEVLAAARNASAPLWMVALAAAIASGVYSAKAAWYLIKPPTSESASRYDTEGRGSRRVEPAKQLALFGLCPFAAALGALALPAPRRWFDGLAGQPGPPPAAWELALSALLAAGAVGACVLVLERRLRTPSWVSRPFSGWLGLEGAARLIVTSPVLSLARLLARFDDSVVDGLVGGTVGGVRRGALLADRRAEAAIDGAVATLAAATRRAATLARRPQTGQLHQYYAQSLVALILLAVAFSLLR